MAGNDLSPQPNEERRFSNLASSSWRSGTPLRAAGRTLAMLKQRLTGASVLVQGAQNEWLGLSYALPSPVQGWGRGGWYSFALADAEGNAEPAVDDYTLRCILANGVTESLQLSKALRVARSRLAFIPDDVVKFSIDVPMREREGAPDRLHVRVRQIGRVKALHTVLTANPSRVYDVSMSLVADPARAYRILKDFITKPAPVTVSKIFRIGMLKPTFEYDEWIETFDRIGAIETAAIRQYVAGLPKKPKFSVVVPVFETAAAELSEMIASVSAQIYENWELCVADDASKRPHIHAILNAAARADSRIKVVFRAATGNISAASNSALDLATGDYVALLDHDDVLAPHALAIMADAINRHPDADIFYSDEDKLDAAGHRHDPYFKPNWNPELFYGQNFINHLSVFRTSLLRSLGGFRPGFEGSQDYDLVLRASAERNGSIIHVPHILYHWRQYPGADTFSSTQLAKATDSARRAIRDHLANRGVAAEVGDAGGGYHRIFWPAPATWPRVSVVIPTRDHADVLETCIDGLLRTTDYPALEIVVVDNNSVESRTTDLFNKLRARGVKVLGSPGAFNYSRLNNEAARASSGELLLFLNNDISMLDDQWLKELAVHALKPDVGAVGAKLLYPDGRLQHGGVILGIGGVAGHVDVGSPGDTHGYFARMLLCQEISCVTGACMLVRRTVFDRIGGFDERNLPVAFSDVDLCIRIRESGYRIIWTPHACLTHHESKSRGLDTSGEKLERFKREFRYMRQRWGDVLDHDPFWNPNLSLHSNDPRISFPPRTNRPWDQLRSWTMMSAVSALGQDEPIPERRA